MGVVPGAAGGPKPLGIQGLDLALFGEWLPSAPRERSLIGASVGSWRFASACLPDAAEGIRRLAPTPETLQRMTQSVPLQRMGRVEEIADMALFLASPHAAFVTGAIMVVDGGSSLAGGRDYSGSLS